MFTRKIGLFDHTYLKHYNFKEKRHIGEFSKLELSLFGFPWSQLLGRSLGIACLVNCLDVSWNCFLGIAWILPWNKSLDSTTEED